MLSLYERHQEIVLSILTDPMHSLERAQSLLMALYQYNEVTTLEKVALLKFSLPGGVYKNLGHLLIAGNYTHKSVLVSHYLNLLSGMINTREAAFEVYGLLLQNLGPDGHFGNYLARYGKSDHFHTFQSLLFTLLAYDLPPSCLLNLLQLQTEQGWTLAHYLCCYQTAAAFHQYCQLLLQLLNHNIPATAIFSLLRLTNDQGYSLDCYVGAYQKTQGIKSYLHLLEHLLALHIPSDWVMRSLREGTVYNTSLGHYLLCQNIEKNRLYLSFLEYSLDRYFSPRDVAILLFATTPLGVSLGRRLTIGGHGRLYRRVLQRLEASGVDIALIYLLRLSSETDLSPISVALNQAQTRGDVAPIFALLEQGYLSELDLSRLLDFKTAVYEYIKCLPKGPEKLAIVERCLNQDDRYSLGQFFHSQRGFTSPSIHHGNLQRLSELAQQLKALLAEEPVGAIGVAISSVNLASLAPTSAVEMQSLATVNGP